MSYTVHNDQTETFERVAVYTAYILGAGILIGLARTVLAIIYIAKHAFYAKSYEAAHQKNLQKHSITEREHLREQENQEAEKNTHKTHGLKKVRAWVAEQGTKLGNAIENAADHIGHPTESALEERQQNLVSVLEASKKASWKEQLLRGISELFYVGTLYHSYRDNCVKNHRVSFLGLDELVQLVDGESQFDGMIKGILGRDRYNPWI